ncbi:MAG TPA: ATP-binding protein, partial [Calditrichia bacterium]|nr:ATP-binding protein [Calditrichia bacterium]
TGGDEESGEGKTNEEEAEEETPDLLSPDPDLSDELATPEEPEEPQEMVNIFAMPASWSRAEESENAAEELLANAEEARINPQDLDGFEEDEDPIEAETPQDLPGKGMENGVSNDGFVREVYLNGNHADSGPDSKDELADGEGDSPEEMFSRVEDMIENTDWEPEGSSEESTEKGEEDWSDDDGMFRFFAGEDSGETVPVTPLNRLGGLPGTSLKDKPRVYTGEYPFEDVYFNQNGSAQLPTWSGKQLGIPVRGMRKLEELLKKERQLFITGAPGCGKTVLLSAFIHHHLMNNPGDEQNFFYYRFPRSGAGVKTFVESIVSHFQGSKHPHSSARIRENPAEALAAGNCWVVLDDIQFADEAAFVELFARLWSTVEKQENFQGHLLMAGQVLPAEVEADLAQVYAYPGLSVAETGALLRDVWSLNLPRIHARRFAAQARGNPLVMQLFRIWWESETHTDTALERLLQNMPSQVEQLFQYMAAHLFESLSRLDNRRNQFLKAISVLPRSESEKFLEILYDRIGGGDFQEELELFVETYGLLEYDYNQDRYHLAPQVSDFYFERIDSDH